MIPNLPKFYTVLDTETLGLDICKHQIIEIGAVLINGSDLKVVSEFQSYIIPVASKSGKIIFEQSALDVNKLSIEFLQKNGKSHEDVWKGFARWIKSYARSNFDVETISCNKAFDIPRIEKHMKGCNIDVPFHYANHYDIKDMMKDFCPQLKKVKLETMCQFFEIPYINGHGALPDSKMTLEVFRELEKLRREFFESRQLVAKE